MRIDLQWAFTEKDMEARGCAICEARFEPRAVVIRVDPHGYEACEACEACLRALSVRKEEEPSAPWPTWEEYSAILAAHPGPMFASEEEMNESQSPDDPWGDDWPAYDESLLWVPEDGDEDVRIAPTVLYKAEPGGMTAAVVEKAGKGRALIVFRSEEAEKYRAATGGNPAAEGWKPVPLDLKDLANVIAMHGCTHVAMPEGWTGEGSVGFFAADDFLGILREGAPA